MISSKHDAGISVEPIISAVEFAKQTNIIDAMFISDLHLNPNEPQLLLRFQEFLRLVVTRTRNLYILGDLLHVWAGDDSITAWSQAIIAQLAALAQHGINVYFMPGNRDFLIGNIFTQQAKLKILSDPTLISCGSKLVLLTHGDMLCTDDKAHQRLRYFTRNQKFIKYFLKLPLVYRQWLVQQVRTRSQQAHAIHKSVDVVTATVVRMMQTYNVNVLIHGHTHKPGLTQYILDQQCYNRYVLSDWDDLPLILCYDNTKGFYFSRM